MAPKPRPLSERFADKVASPSTADGCFIWTGAVATASGAPVVIAEWPDRRMVSARRVAVELFTGRVLPVGTKLKPICGNELCVHPPHLSIWTPGVDGFWRALNRVTVTGCWEWTGAVNSDGYGQLFFRGSHWSAHRLAWYLSHGDHARHGVLHTCDNPPCCRPEHLFDGTPKDNTADSIAKNRYTAPTSRKLTDQQVQEILARAPNERYTDLAAEFRVSASTISRVARRRAYGDHQGASAESPTAKLVSRAILSEEDVRAIRRAYEHEAVTITSLTSRYPVGYAAIWAIVRRKTWPDLY